MRVLLPILLLATAAHAVVQPTKYASLSLNLRGLTSRQSSGGYTLDSCKSDADCKPPRFCALTLCIIGAEDDKPCKSCAECPGYKDGEEVCAIDPEAGITCISASNASNLGLRLTDGCEKAPKFPNAGSSGGPPREPRTPVAPTPVITPPEDAVPPGQPTPDEPVGVPFATDPPPTTEVVPSTAPQPTEPESSTNESTSVSETSTSKDPSSAPSTSPSDSKDESTPNEVEGEDGDDGDVGDEEANESGDEVAGEDEGEDEGEDGNEDENEGEGGGDGDEEANKDGDEAKDGGAGASEEPEITSGTEGGNTQDENSADASPPPICIAVKHLAHLPAHDLVFTSHMRARVLCDTKESCATPGHIVVFRGRPMMMQSYCLVAHGGCMERRKLVNSPRFKRKIVVPSRTDGLHFTALAARYETRLEEHALKLAVRVGL